MIRVQVYTGQLGAERPLLLWSGKLAAPPGLHEEVIVRREGRVESYSVHLVRHHLTDDIVNVFVR